MAVKISEDYLHRFKQTWLAEVDIFTRVEILQCFNQCRYIHIVVVVKMAEPPDRERRKKYDYASEKLLTSNVMRTNIFWAPKGERPRASGFKASLSELQRALLSGTMTGGDLWVNILPEICTCIHFE